MKKGTAQTDPPKASKVKIKKKGNRGNEYIVDIDGTDFQEGNEYLVKVIFNGPAGDNNYPFDVDAESGSFAKTDGEITSEYFTENYDQFSICDVEWINPSNETCTGVEVEWSTIEAEDLGFLGSIIAAIQNFFRNLFGGN